MMQPSANHGSRAQTIAHSLSYGIAIISSNGNIYLGYLKEVVKNNYVV